MLDRRSEILEQLVDARETTESFPGAIAAAKKEHRAAEAKLADLRQKLEDAHAAVAEFDRPLKRRRHAGELTSAQRALDELPRRVDAAAGAANAFADRVDQLQSDLANARRAIHDRSPLRPELARLDTSLDRDARARARDARLHVGTDRIDEFGLRPVDVGAGQDWDRTVGEWAQRAVAYPSAVPLAGSMRAMRSV